MKRCAAVALALAWTGAADVSFAQPQPAWVLMSREGECVEIAGAQRRRFSELPPIVSPRQLVDEWRRRGVKVTFNPMPGTNGEVVMVEAPSQELTLLFALRSRCASVTSR